MPIKPTLDFNQTSSSNNSAKNLDKSFLIPQTRRERSFSTDKDNTKDFHTNIPRVTSSRGEKLLAKATNKVSYLAENDTSIPFRKSDQISLDFAERKKSNSVYFQADGNKVDKLVKNNKTAITVDLEDSDSDITPSTFSSIKCTRNKSASLQIPKSRGHTNTETSIVLTMYTDGACKGNNNVTSKLALNGWGVVILEGNHTSKSKSMINNIEVASLTRNSQLITELYGKVELDPKSVYYMGATVGSNNTAELTAVGEALHWLQDYGHEYVTSSSRNDSQPKIRICFDSEYAFKSITGVFNGPKNVALIKHIRQLLNTVEEKLKCKVIWEKVKAHSKDTYNDRADELANFGCRGLTCQEGRYQSICDREKSIQMREDLLFLSDPLNPTRKSSNASREKQNFSNSSTSLSLSISSADEDNDLDNMPSFSEYDVKNKYSKQNFEDFQEEFMGGGNDEDFEFVKPSIDNHMDIIRQKDNDGNNYNIDNNAYLPVTGQKRKYDSISMSLLDQIHFANEKIFKNKNFRPKQLEIIFTALKGKDVFVNMPTGGGKSLCFQLPAVIDKGVTIVVSPLLSLIQDQVINMLTRYGIPCAHITSHTQETLRKQVYRELFLARKGIEPSVKLLYVTPECLCNSDTMGDALVTLYEEGMLARLIIDEAHCVSQWGHDFREDYRNLDKFRHHFPDVPCMALTATAPPYYKADIMERLMMNIHPNDMNDLQAYANNDTSEMVGGGGSLSKRTKLNSTGSTSFQNNSLSQHYGSCKRQGIGRKEDQLIEKSDNYYKDGYVAIFNVPIRRTNLYLDVLPKNSKKDKAKEDLYKWISTYGGGARACGIVYCMTQKETSELSDYLREKGIHADYYHAGQTEKERKMVQHKWQANEVQVVCATIAYAMGIDKADVRYVVHYSIAKSMEGYYQEAGRAGRDGALSNCVIFYRKEDVSKMKNLMAFSNKGARRKQGSGTHRLGFNSKKAGGLSDADRLEIMVQYCENTEECRHKLISEYFGEKVEYKGNRGCRDMCNICSKKNIIAINLAKNR